jgi:hypothetical protein
MPCGVARLKAYVMLDVKKFVSELHDYLERAIAPLASELKELRARQPERGEKGADGLPGKDGAPGLHGERGVDGIAGKDGAPGERGEKGDPGRDGNDGSAGEKGEKGDPGRDGKDGSPGEKGEKGEKGEIGAPGEKGIDGSHGKDGEAGRDGRDGNDGLPGGKGDPGKDGLDGKNGEKGADGASVTVDQVLPLLEASVSKWMLEWERRAQDTLSKAVERIPVPKDGRDGIDGTAGRDGFGFDDLSVEYDGERALSLVFERAGQRKVFAFTLPVQIHRGVWKAGRYSKDDNITYGGSTWLALCDTDASPGGSDDWRLIVKRGKDAS